MSDDQNTTVPIKFNPETKVQEIMSAPSYRKAYKDAQFLEGDDSREIRLLSEYLKADLAFHQKNILSTIIVFGSARIKSPETAQLHFKEAEAELKKNPESAEAVKNMSKAREELELSAYYKQAGEFSRIVTEYNNLYNPNPNDKNYGHPYHYVICTGGGPGIMEAANRGASDAGGISIGLNISLPFEQKPNPYITPDLCFQYHYFAIRKLHFMLRARALVVFPGGFGTFDELFEGLTLRQTGRMQNLPIIMFGENFWRSCINFEYLAKTGMISTKDLDLFHFVNTPEEAWSIIRDFYAHKETS